MHLVFTEASDKLQQLTIITKTREVMIFNECQIEMSVHKDHSSISY